MHGLFYNACTYERSPLLLFWREAGSFFRPATDQPHISPLPPPSSVLEEEEDIDIETVFSSEANVLTCGQEKPAVLRRSLAGLQRPCVQTICFTSSHA